MKIKPIPKEEMLKKIKEENKEDKEYNNKFKSITENFANDNEIEQQQVLQIKMREFL
jgi:L-fucose isomerase-like protein